MPTLPQNQLIKLFKSYQWNTLFESVKDVTLDKSKPIQSQQTLALKAMLLVSWWADSIASREILKLYPPIIKDLFTHFCITYGYLCLGDLKMFKHYLSKIPKDTPKWMRVYLDIELYGRNLKFDKQISLVRKLTPKNQYPQEYIKVALLQSLEHSEADISYLKQFIKDINLKEDDDPISIALCLRVGLIDIETIDTNRFPLLLARKSSHLYKKMELKEALISYDKLANTKFLDINSINTWLMMAVSIPQGAEYLIKRVEFSLSLTPHSLFIQGTLASYALIDSYKKGNYALAYNLVQKYIEYMKLPANDFIRNPQIFFNYILKLCIHWQHNKAIYNTNQNSKKLYVFGESHSLSLSNISIELNANKLAGNTNFIMGIKMYHLKPNKDTFHSSALKLYLEQLPNHSNLIFTIGEIDTRPSEGIWKNHNEKGKDIDTLIEDTVVDYIEFLSQNLKPKVPNSITIQGIPAPGYEFKDKLDPGENIDGFLEMFVKINNLLKQLTLKQGWNFLDVYSATVAEDKRGNKEWHIDGIHLQPLIYTQVDKWLIKPELKPNTMDFSKYQTVSLGKPS